MNNRFRLASNHFERETESEKIEPQKIFFLSVEGNVTEREYFEGLSKYRTKLGINGKVDVEILKRSSKDTNSAPKYVLELLEEYLRLRELGKEKMIEEIPEKFVQKYGADFIKKYIENPEGIKKKERNQFVVELRKIGYDINYRKYLNSYKNEGDEFGILIDRDVFAHSKKNMQECIRHCKKKNYNCYISNPCFEFWLLLHLSDVEVEYKDELEKIMKNEKVSRHHTFVSKELSDKAHHGKGGIGFANNYLPYVFDAVERAKKMERNGEPDILVDNIGCNLWKLIEILKAF